MTRAEALTEAADLIERRLVQTTGFGRTPADTWSDYQRGIHFALREAQALLREEAGR